MSWGALLVFWSVDGWAAGHVGIVNFSAGGAPTLSGAFFVAMPT